MQIVIMSAKDTWSTKETGVPVKQTEKAEYANKSVLPKPHVSISNF